MSKFKIGDRVIVVRKDYYTTSSMEHFINDGIVYVVNRVVNYSTPRVYAGFLSESGDSLFFQEDSLEFADKAAITNHAKPIKKAKKKKLGSLRMTLRKKIEEEKGTCSWAIKTKTGRKFNISMACHAQLKYDVGVTQLFYGLSNDIFQIRDKKNMPAYKAYVKYILNESPWAPMFKTKLWNIANRYEIEMDVSYSINQIGGACIALRQGSEFQDMLPMFEEVLKRKYPSHVAFIASTIFYRKIDKIMEKCNGGSHHILSPSMNFDGLIKFFNNGYWNDDKKDIPYSKAAGAYNIFNSISPLKVNSTLKIEYQKLPRNIINKGGWNETSSFPEESLTKFLDDLTILIKA